MEVTFGSIVRIVSLVLAAYGLVCGIVIWFYPYFNAGGFMTGMDMILLNALMGLSEIVKLPFFEYLIIFYTPWGKGAVWLFLGALWAGTAGLWIANWIIFWVAGIFFIVLKFIPQFELAPPFIDRTEDQGGSRYKTESPDKTAGDVNRDPMYVDQPQSAEQPAAGASYT